MRMIWTVLWAFLLSFMTAYVVSNMAGTSFSFLQVIIMTILFSVAAIVLGEGVIKEEA
ncbi:YjzD family protein [Halobacillus sp. A1]|uniref:YjzD family protein n=1 Tax=Halobacillus campisalis TaxID=435909 RepID=A0ABW2K4W8_9BACI|nr:MULTISPECIES: YjzD family protein [Halobacillus]MCP3031993.1 YjzD family protein [Halobacillus sp. A1]